MSRSRHRSPAEEPFLPHTETESEAVKHGPTLTRNRVLLLALATSTLVWLLLVLQTGPLPPTIDPSTITSIDSVLITDPDGNRKWAWDIPTGLSGLLPEELYGQMCREAQRASDSAAGHGHHAHHGYYWVDENFLDPTAPSGQADMCERSLTYLLESSELGLGTTLLSLWTAYGLARRENRTFFIADGDWKWGAYASYFLPPTTSSCRPPPPHLVLPCPHQTAHLLVAHSTRAFTFGGAFGDTFEDARKMGVLRQREIFAMARDGYEGLFRLRLRPEDEDAVEERKKVFQSGMTGVHVRRGDARDKAFQWRETQHVPVAHYAELVKNGSTGVGTVLLASDDPGVYAQEEFAAYVPAQEGNPEVRRMTGGWRRDVFSREVDGTEMRGLGGEYFRDVKVLGETVGRVYCGGNSATCRVLGVIMGWKAAVEEGGWVNVDDERGWFGVDW